MGGAGNDVSASNAAVHALAVLQVKLAGIAVSAERWWFVEKIKWREMVLWMGLPRRGRLDTLDLASTI